MCTLMDKLEPRLKGKPYAESLPKFVVAPIALEDKKSPGEILKEAKGSEKKGKVDEARKSYHLLVGAALAKEGAPARDVKRYLTEYMNFVKRRKLPTSGYFPTKRDCLTVTNHLDEILSIVREAYRKPEAPKVELKK